MKTKLLLPALLLSIAGFAQEPIGSFYSSTIVDGAVNEDKYLLVDSETPIDQSAAGANVVWNFDGLTEYTQSYTSVIIPSAADIAEYPTTNWKVQTRTITGNGENITNYFLNVNDIGGTSLTGAEASGIVLNYSTNNAFLGDFPISYEYTNTDQVAGNFEGQGVEGTFTGTGTVTVDAYGTLTVNEGIADATPVTRLKTVQNLTLNYLGFPVGTLEQTIYSYYNTDVLATGPIFRSITTHVVVESAEVDQTVESYESYEATALNVKDITLASNKLLVVPNPVNNVLHFEGNTVVNSVSIADITGKIVLIANTANDINVGALNSGVYFISTQTETGVQFTKIVKQ
ncbi:T9SS type A sorting domain-containing protein [Flavobacterium zepuense]|uniref:T9SS type A sorting domain-containing protein n=1 Tax=Flavobacterium zepuense TaxID=2593302 RepID=A0A552V7U4_9FLAO|nr:T9SS type A sorting domain-containing protein [Flavobacterium zepuense]TRW26535.1 T9SS type A sorting domain-containing protein [Flavobacterium zepuense]